MTKDTLYVGLDTDKRQIDVAVAEELPHGETRYWGKVANDPAAVDRLVKRLQQGRRLVMCYEAGPCGYGLYRQLSGKPEVTCAVVAPSMTPAAPRRAGEDQPARCVDVGKAAASPGADSDLGARSGA